MNIQINVTDKRASVVGAPVIVCGNSDYLVDFSFDSEWSQAAAKTARFVYIRDGVVHHQDVVFDGTTAAVPVLVGIKEVRVGVFAGDLRTSTPALIPCELSIRCSTGAPEDPTPSQYDQIMALLAAGGGGGGTGSPGKDGEDGVSPTVAVENITGGHRVTITDADGAKSFDVMDGQDGQDGQPGKDGAAGQPGKDGEDGVSPTVAVTTIPGGHRVTITDASGVKYFDVMDGQDGEGGSTSGGGTGQDGADGVSPTVSVTTITGGHRVTIIDVDGAKSFDVMNGQDGQPGKDGADGQNGQDGAAGKDGEDGVSPTVSVTAITGGHRVTVTDAKGSKTFDVMDGQAGQDGAPGQPGEPGQDGQPGKDGQDGQPGKDGADGVSPTIAVTAITGGHRVTITGADGAKSFDVMDGQDGAAGATGATGQTGQTGPAGYTPVRGTDYWTPADVAEMKAHLDEKIINGEW